MRHKDTIWANALFIFILILYLNFYILYSFTEIYEKTKQNFVNRGLKAWKTMKCVMKVEHC